MSKNTKKKNAIRFGALAVAALLFLGVFSAWAQGADAQASAEIGEVEIDDITVAPGEDDGETLLEPSIAGRPGTLDLEGTEDSSEEAFELYEISEEETGALEDYEYVATVYLLNGADLVEAGMRYMTLDMEIVDDGGTEVDSGALTLEGGRTSLTFTGDDFTDTEGEEAIVQITGGSFGTYPFADFETVDNVEFMIDIEPTREAPE